MIRNNFIKNYGRYNVMKADEGRREAFNTNSELDLSNKSFISMLELRMIGMLNQYGYTSAGDIFNTRNLQRSKKILRKL